MPNDRDGETEGRDLRGFIRCLFGFVEPGHRPHPRPRIVRRLALVLMGPFRDHLPTEQETMTMATGKKGQFAVLKAIPKSESGGPGELGSEIAYESSDESVAIVGKTEGGVHYVELVGQGSATLRVSADSDPTEEGTAEIEAVALVVCDDPADNAKTFEFEVGGFTDERPTD